MICLDNKQKIDAKLFSDGTQRINNIGKISFNEFTYITWVYESDSELVTLEYLVMYLRDQYPGIEIYLIMPYVPNARMDRVETDYEVFTLKYFSRIINSLNFTSVTVLDTHSRVTDALIDRIKVISPDKFIEETKHLICQHAQFDVSTSLGRKSMYGEFREHEKFVYFFPDKGAYDKYKKLDSVNSQCAGVLYGEKTRNWETCEIEDFSVRYADKDGSCGSFETPVLIIDDIISSGGTIVRSVEQLKILGFKNIYVYCSHLENRFDTDEHNALRDMLENGEIKALYTTGSLYFRKKEKKDNKVIILNTKIYA